MEHIINNIEHQQERTKLWNYLHIGTSEIIEVLYYYNDNDII